MKQTLSLIALFAVTPVFAEDARQLDAHEHGVGTLNVAIEGPVVAIEFNAPGADIVGFEHAAESEADHEAIATAVSTLSAPLELFALPDAASCKVSNANVELKSQVDHDDHDEHTEEDHEAHGDEDHDDHADEDHMDHSEDTGHTEFHAEYTLTCGTPEAINQITFAYFEAFPNAKEVEVQIVTATGAQAFEVERDAPALNLER